MNQPKDYFSLKVISQTTYRSNAASMDVTLQAQLLSSQNKKLKLIN